MNEYIFWIKFDYIATRSGHPPASLQNGMYAVWAISKFRVESLT